MKKQRIFLHTLILVLAAACFGTAAYGWTKYANVKAKNEYRWEYQDQYETLVTDSLQDIVAQYLYIKNFSDNKKVLVESSEYGNLTAKDIKKLYKDEDSRVTINPHAEQKVAIVYPNTYFVGMSNLGLHII